MELEPLSPISDIVFKMLFGNEKNTDILSAFLKAVLLLPEEEFSEVTLVNPFQGSEYPNEKTTILDVKATTASGRRIDIEIQVQNQKALEERIVFYAAKMLTEQLAAGEGYSKLRPVVCILLTDFCMIENTYYHNRYRLHDPQTGSEFSDLMEVNVLELPKIQNATKTNDATLLQWMKFLKATNREELDMLAQNNPDIQKAVKRLYTLSEDQKARMLAEDREKFRRDQEQYVMDALERGLEKGRIEGREEGREEERKEFARKMLQHSFPLEQIVEMTGFSRQEIEALEDAR